MTAAGARRDERFAELLVPACLRLLPGDVAAFALDDAGERAPPPARAAFQEEARPAAGGGCGDAGRLACRALFLALAGPLGGAARAWWGSAPPRAARALERVTRAFVAPELVRRQLRRVQQRGPELGARVAVRWAAREVECEFAVEERPVRLRVALGAAHPLSLPAVAAPPGGAGSPAPATAWLGVYLAHRNGSLLHALRMWMTALHARVDASPQCYVCYCRLHPSTGRLPLVTCRQCRNRFHNECLVSARGPRRRRGRRPPADPLLSAARVVRDRRQVHLPAVPRDLLAPPATGDGRVRSPAPPDPRVRVTTCDFGATVRVPLMTFHFVRRTRRLSDLPIALYDAVLRLLNGPRKKNKKGRPRKKTKRETSKR